MTPIYRICQYISKEKVIVRFIFNLEPVSQARPRISRYPYLHEYDTKEVKAFKENVNLMAQKMMQEHKLAPFDGSLEVRVVFYRPVQKSISKIEHARRVRGSVLPSVKSDLDNYIKSFFDGCNGAIWKDDNLITDLHAVKRYSDEPRIELEVLQLG
ncbi:RusA family crossover junction endodeoxyribonuclease [Lactobacillus kalixensis]|uniref:Holliday junction resolvase n=1 Tax=Lactobacillus kalixensis DSM 16043 TaxID=1423763 RepID=A0A0R1U9A9_9LACO|nr:RusA family crossover junction endodeoxyribonuclease [Lactobacillus kalixensis]KRL89872.1 hypothetical protein FC46_GL000520 [Lactobacillus kalixensis DSM 16043]